jgi:RNA polymerase sigma-70 factor (ECF subfamily)
VRDLESDVELTPAERDVIDVELAVTGDSQAFERLYRRHVARIHGLARWLMSRDDVEDVLQDIFIRVWEKLHTFKGEAAFATWLHRLATNVILRRRSERGTRGERFGGSELDLSRAVADRVTPGLKVDLEAAVDRLPEKAREVFVLHDMAGYKHEEIGSLLGVSSGTSRSQLHHARMALRQYLEA